MANQNRAKKCSWMGWIMGFQFFPNFCNLFIMKKFVNFFGISLLYKHTVSPRFNRSVSANENSNSCNVSLLKITEIKNNELSIDTVDDETSSFATCSDAEQYGNIGYQVFKGGIKNQKEFRSKFKIFKRKKLLTFVNRGSAELSKIAKNLISNVSRTIKFFQIFLFSLKNSNLMAIFFVTDIFCQLQFLKVRYSLKRCAIFDGSVLCSFTKYNNFP